MKGRFLTGCMAILLLAVACAPASPKDEGARTLFSVLDRAHLDGSLLKPFATGKAGAKPKLRVCFDLRSEPKPDGIEFSAGPEITRFTIGEADIVPKLKLYLDTSMKAWIHALAGAPGWTVPKVDLGFESKACPEDAAALKVIVFLDDRAMKTHCLKEGFEKALCRSYALPALKSFYVLNDGTLDETLEFMVAHEMGHLMGLGDLYDEAGVRSGLQIVAGKALMNSPRWDFSGPTRKLAATLSDDDRVGIRTVWSILKGGKKECPGGYTPTSKESVGGTKVDANDLICLPRSAGSGRPAPAASSSAPGSASTTRSALAATQGKTSGKGFSIGPRKH